MTLENTLVRELAAATGSQRQALKVVGLSRSTWHYRQSPRARVAVPILQAARAYESRISDIDQRRIEERILAGWAAGNSVDHAFATAWDAGVMLASRRSWWRIAARLEDQLLRPKLPTRTSSRQARDKPVLKATGPGQVWSWDITDLYSPWRGKTFKAYKVIDIYSRRIVGFRVEDREVDSLARDMFEDAIRAHGAPQFVHADSGAAMRSTLLRDALAAHGVGMSHNRPYTSNDNPFSEAGFRTMKYRPGYPKVFTDLDAARAYIQDYVTWYNTEHRHSAIALFTPAQVHDGSWQQIWTARDTALQVYHDAHPARFRARPKTPSPASRVGINLPNEPVAA